MQYYILYDQEYWRLVSPIMLHAGIFHLLCNVAVQLDQGVFWEREWGSFVWLIVYLVSAVWGSIMSVIVIPNSVGVGSSGSVCGLFGAKLAEGTFLFQNDDTSGISSCILSHTVGTRKFNLLLYLLYQ